MFQRTNDLANSIDKDFSVLNLPKMPKEYNYANSFDRNHKKFGSEQNR